MSLTDGDNDAHGDDWRRAVRAFVSPIRPLFADS